MQDISQNGVRFIKNRESLKLCSYLCPAQIPSIGYGHSLLPNENYTKITVQVADQLFANDIAKLKEALSKIITINLSQNKADALYSLVYNWGITKFRQSKGLKYLNQGKFDEAAIEFFSRKCGVVKVRGEFCNGLFIRRQAELVMWNAKT